MTGKIDAIKMDTERLKEDKLKMDDMQYRLVSIENMVKEGNEIAEFNRYLFDAMVEKVVVGEGDVPYKIKSKSTPRPSRNMRRMHPNTSSRKRSAGPSTEKRTYRKQTTLKKVSYPIKATHTENACLLTLKK